MLKIVKDDPAGPSPILITKSGRVINTLADLLKYDKTPKINTSNIKIYEPKKRRI